MKENNQPIKKILLPYAGIMVILCIFAQVVIALRGSSIDFIAGLALMPAFIYYLYFNVMFKNRLSNCCRENMECGEGKEECMGEEMKCCEKDSVHACAMDAKIKSEVKKDTVVAKKK